MKFLLASPLLVIAFSLSAFAQENVIELRNADVFAMVTAKIPTQEIINKIETSRCHFDTFPTVISELRYRGIPEEILVAMVAAPVGRPTRPAEKKRAQPVKTNEVTLPAVDPPKSTSTAATANAPESTGKTSSEPVVTPSKTASAAASLTTDQSAKHSDLVPEKVLKNDDLMKLLRSGTPANEVVKVVKSSRGEYDFSAKALFDLQQAGAEATIFLSMMEASRAAQKDQKKSDDQTNLVRTSNPTPTKP
jgi:hypothetical protein